MGKVKISDGTPVFFGLDPDLHNTALAGLDRYGNLCLLDLATVPAELKGREAAVAMCEAVSEICCGPEIVSLAAPLAVVESQQIYATGPSRTKNPDDILLICNVSGAACAAFRTCGMEVMLLKPSDWKGSVKKHIHQSRVLGRLGLRSQVRGNPPKRGAKDGRYAVPQTTPDLEEWSRFGTTQWKHLVDAIGMAQFAMEHRTRAERKARALKALE